MSLKESCEPAWAEAHYYPPVTAFTRYLPLPRDLVRAAMHEMSRFYR